MVGTRVRRCAVRAVGSWEREAKALPGLEPDLKRKVAVNSIIWNDQIESGEPHCATNTEPPPASSNSDSSTEPAELGPG